MGLLFGWTALRVGGIPLTNVGGEQLSYRHCPHSDTHIFIECHSVWLDSGNLGGEHFVTSLHVAFWTGRHPGWVEPGQDGAAWQDKTFSFTYTHSLNSSRTSSIT